MAAFWAARLLFRLELFAEPPPPFGTAFFLLNLLAKKPLSLELTPAFLGLGVLPELVLG